MYITNVNANGGLHISSFVELTANNNDAVAVHSVNLENIHLPTFVYLHI